jgi:hypothetical protein
MRVKDGRNHAMTHDAATADADVAVAQLDSVLTDARSAFARAVSAVGVIESVRWIAGDPVCIRFAGDALIDHLAPALEHHPIADPRTAPVLTVNAWDEGSTGAPVPELPDDGAPRTPARSIVGKSHAASSSSERRLFEGYDRERGEAWFGVGSPAALTHGERGAPFRLVFHWMGSPRGRVLAHAGAVGVDGAGVLLVGPGGVGKSSTSLACAEAGFEYAADDYCLVTTEPSPTAFGLYATGKVKPVDLPRYPGLRDTAGSLYHETDDKVLLVVSRARHTRVVEQIAVRAIAVPTLVPSQVGTSMSRTSASHALQALAPSTVGQVAGGAAATLRTLAALTRALPCYELALGSDRAAVPEAISQLLENAGQA